MAVPIMLSRVTSAASSASPIPSVPAGRIGTDEDMAGAAIYLASRAGDYVIGETITVDGGLVHAALGTSIDA